MLFTKKPDGTLVLVEGDDLTIEEEIADIDEAKRKTRILLGKADDDDDDYDDEEEDLAYILDRFFEWRPSPPPNSPVDPDVAQPDVADADQNVADAVQNVAKPEPDIAGI